MVGYETLMLCGYCQDRNFHCGLDFTIYLNHELYLFNVILVKSIMSLPERKHTHVWFHLTSFYQGESLLQGTYQGSLLSH